MKPSVRDIVGRTIETVVVSEDNGAGPRDQIFLVFSDGTCYELYGDLRGSGNVVVGDRDWAIRYASKFQGRISVFERANVDLVVGANADDETLPELDVLVEHPGDVEHPSTAEERGGGTILVVDDDSRVREAYRKILEGEGYSVVDAPDGFSGFNVFSECIDELAAVILDYRMPRMNGDKALAMMRRIDSTIPVIVASYLPWEGGIQDVFPEGSVAGYVQLPVAASDLLHILREVILA